MERKIHMEFFTLAFLSSLVLIVGIDLILAGDNAIVIAMAARRLPAEQRKRAILYGTVGAVIIRAIATLIVVWLLQVPGLHIIGGALLIWIAYGLLKDNQSQKEIKAGASLAAAVRTIIVADALMGLDNVLAVAGAAHGSYLLVIAGLLVSVPLIMGGSAVFLKLTDRFTWIVYAGTAVLAYTAGKMLFNEPILGNLVEDYAWAKWLTIAFVTAAVLFFGWRSQTKRRKLEQHQSASLGVEMRQR